VVAALSLVIVQYVLVRMVSLEAIVNSQPIIHVNINLVLTVAPASRQIPITITLAYVHGEQQDSIVK
jgi:hypothetical protein